MAELEAKQFADGDGADSAIQSDDEVADDHWTRVRPAAESLTQAKGPHEEDDEEDDSDENSDDDADRLQLAGMMGAAAFGGTGHYARGGASDAGSMPSENSSARRRGAFKDAFPVRGVTCVGCALANRIGPVNRFVRDNISQVMRTPCGKWRPCATSARSQSHGARGLHPTVELEGSSRAL